MYSLNPRELLAVRRKALYWDDCFNIKSVQPANLNWNTSYGGWEFTNHSTRYLWIICQMIHAKAMQTPIEFHLHWMPTTNDVDVVKWDAEYWWKNAVGDTAQGAVGGGGTNVTMNATPNGTAYVLQIDDFAMWAAPMATEEVSAIVTIRLRRDGAVDAHPNTVLLKDFDPHVEHDSFGSIGHDAKWS